MEWLGNEIDKLLVNEVIKKESDLEKIKSFVSKGANVNIISDFGDSLLKELIKNYEADGGNIKFNVIILLLDLGSDINYELDGFNCLFEAHLRNSPELVKLLLERGANPNCISTDTPESIYDYIKWDRDWEVGDEQICQRFEWGQKWADDAGKIIELLEQYGAKTYNELKKINNNLNSIK